MTRQNMRGGYFPFTHDRAQDWDYLAKWQPNVIRLMLPGSIADPASVDVNRIRRVHDTCPDATLLIRVWEVDDRNFEAHADMVANPRGEAQRQLDWWARLFDRAVGVPRTLLMAGLNNETGPEKDAALYDYTEHALTLGTARGVRCGALVFSVGRPSLPGESQYDMDYFSRLEPLFLAGNHAAVYHEYFQPEGMYAVWTDEQGNERKDYTYLIGRHTRWPMRVPVIIGEWGLDGLLYNRHPHPQYGNSGWRNFRDEWTPDRFADEYVECIRQAAPNVIGICPFLSDFADRKWASFDIVDAYPQLIARKDLCVRDVATPPSLPPIAQPPAPIETHLPIIEKPAPQEPTPAPSGDNWARSREFVKRWEGGWADNPDDPGGATNKGITIGTYTQWLREHGQAVPTKDDLRNISDEETDRIFYEWYWLRSGADKLEWPLCLAHFDTAVNAGPGRAAEMMQKSGGNFLAYMGHLMTWYTQIKNFEIFGRAWIRRRAEILLEASKP